METPPNVPIDPVGTWFSFRTMCRYIGPGWLMSLAFIDPGNIEADLQSGAFTGFTFAYVLVIAHIAGLIIQTFASRIAVVTGKGLARTCREQYSCGLSFFLWVMTELAIIGSDVQEVIGTAVALNLLFGWPIWWGCLVTAGCTIVFLCAYLLHGIGLIEYGVVGAIGLILGCFSLNFFASNPNYTGLFTGLFVPTFPQTRAETVQLVAMIGSVIMPHNLFLHSAIISKRKINQQDTKAVDQGIKYFVFDAILALSVSFLINLALQGSFAQGFYSPVCALNPSGPLGCDPSEHAESVGCDLARCACITPAGLPGVCTQIGLANAGDALAGILPGKATVLFGVGLLAAGQASTLSGTMAGQFVMEGFLEIKVSFWIRMFVTRGIALIPALAVALMQTSDIGMNNLSQSLNVLQSIQLPFALIPLLHFCSQERIMGKFSVSKKLRLVGWTLALLLISVNGYIMQQQFGTAVCSVGGIAYVLLLVYLVTKSIDRTQRTTNEEFKEPVPVGYVKMVD